MITVDGTGTIGGIDASVYPFWRNQFKDGGSISAANIEGSMNELWLDCTRGTDQPDLIVSSNEIFAFYWASQQDKQRYTSPREGNAGFTSLKYVGADVIHDGGSGIADNRMYFLNTDYLYLTVHRAANWAIDEEKMSVNQDAVVIPLLWMGNLVTSNRARQGVLFT